MGDIWIRGGRILDAETGTDAVLDLLVRDGRICKVGGVTAPASEGTRVIDASGMTVMPGIVDMHVHFRDPGQTRKEDFETGSAAAAHGGITTAVAMPNTSPVIDTGSRFAGCQERADKVSRIRVIQAGSLTMGEEGKELSEIEAMAEAGALVLSEDGKSVMDAALCRKAFEEAARYDLLILDHCEDINLRGDGCMNLDENALRLGLPGISASVEDTITARDMLLAAETGARLHLCHVSTENAVHLLRFARERGWSHITAEACPHHFILSSDDIQKDDPDYKMNPPLRRRQDVEEIRRGLQDGTIPVISTDHAPHTKEDKMGSMLTAAFGIVGLETSLALTYTSLVRTGVLTELQMVEKMCANPAKLLGLSCGTIQEGRPADLAIVDFEHPWRIDRQTFFSKGRNTPFDGWEVYGKVMTTIYGGRVVYDSETDCQD